MLLTHKNNSVNLNNFEKHEIYSALEICIRQNYFKFNNTIYSQLNGLPMGSPLSPLLSEIFIDFLENQIFTNNPITKNVLHWARYVDDVFCIWAGKTENFVYS